MPRLAHIPTYKEKSATLKEVPLGLYIYPVLQAADILLYRLVIMFHKGWFFLKSYKFCML
jgi:tryptophanyl-tRNA synthetase